MHKSAMVSSSMSTGEMEDHLLGVDETWFFVVRGHGNAAIAQHTHTHT